MLVIGDEVDAILQSTRSPGATGPTPDGVPYHHQHTLWIAIS